MKKFIGMFAIVLLAGVASVNAQSRVPNRASHRYGADAVTGSVRERIYWHVRRNSGPVYSRCYMNCMNSGHPADFCQNDASSFCSS
jgi:hypothetical protein